MFSSRGRFFLYQDEHAHSGKPKALNKSILVITRFGDLRERAIDLSKYGALLIDAEGAEMLILSGAHEFQDFRYIQRGRLSGTPRPPVPISMVS